MSVGHVAARSIGDQAQVYGLVQQDVRFGVDWLYKSNEKRRILFKCNKRGRCIRDAMLQLLHVKAYRFHSHSMKTRGQA